MTTPADTVTVFEIGGYPNGVAFVDDSLSTNVLPTLAAVAAFPGRRVALLVGGFDRGIDLASAIEQGTAKVVERGGRITGYATMLAFWGHAAAETNPDLQALIAGADSFGGPGILVPSRNAELFRWCLANGMRVVQPMTLMSVGLYNDPVGAWLPSILF